MARVWLASEDRAAYPSSVEELNALAAEYTLNGSVVSRVRRQLQSGSGYATEEEHDNRDPAPDDMTLDTPDTEPVEIPASGTESGSDDSESALSGVDRRLVAAAIVVAIIIGGTR